jgi:hypothetical protein
MDMELNTGEMEQGMMVAGRTIFDMVLELSFLPMEASSTEGNGRMEHKSNKVVLISIF